MEAEIISQLRPAPLDSRVGDNISVKWKDFKQEFELYMTETSFLSSKINSTEFDPICPVLVLPV